MKFIRILWGDYSKYENQILESKNDKLNEMIFVWGKDNFDKLTDIGYECTLISDDPYDYNIADNHTFINYKSLIHKIIGIETALKIYDEIVFLDWDCRKTKDIDDRFFELIRNKNSEIQVPLYTYPILAFERLISDTTDITMLKFFTKLKMYVEQYSFKYADNYIIPNTGFFYCSNVKIIENLLTLIAENDLETVPDEFSVFLFTKSLGLDGYIEKIEPFVIDGKEHGYHWWNDMEADFMKYKNKTLNKEIYFKHL